MTTKIKFRDPKTVEVFEDIMTAASHYCCSPKKNTSEECGPFCPLHKSRFEDGKFRCTKGFCQDHPAEAARLMGLEVVEDETERRNGKMELKDTIEMMNSEDYKERFKAEYWQTKIRYEKLHKTCIKYEAGTLNFAPSCSLELLKEQNMHMGMYLHALEVRAEIEKIDLYE